MYNSKTISFAEVSDTSRVLIRNFCRLISTTLIDVYYIGSNGALCLSPNPELNNVMRYFLNEILSEWTTIEKSEDALVRVSLEIDAFNNGYVMNVLCNYRGMDNQVRIRNFDSVCNEEYNQVQMRVMQGVKKQETLTLYDLLLLLQQHVFLKIGRNF